MNELRCLYLDNEPDHLVTFKLRLELAWKRVSRDIVLHVETVATIEEALQKLTSSIRSYHLFVADLYFANPLVDEPNSREITQGLPIIAEARRLAIEAEHPLRILALSKGGHSDERDAETAGADRFLSKIFLATRPDSPAELARALSELLTPIIEQMVPQADVLSFDKDNLSLRALVEWIGPTVLLRLVRQLADEPVQRAHIAFLRAGLSGAAVLRVECNILRSGSHSSDTVRLLLKVSRDAGSIVDEYHHRQVAALFPPNLFILPINHEPVTASGWHAIGYPFIDGSGTLLDWLTIPTRDLADISRTMGMLFLSATQTHVYQNATFFADERPTASLRRNLTTSRSARVMLALRELGGLASKHGAGTYDESIIRRFILGGRIGSISEEETPRGAYLCRAHGDLHARNILIDYSGRPYLIDPANITQLHWASDFARLCADLLISGLSANDRAHEWEDLLLWIDTCRTFVSGNFLETVRSGQPVLEAVQWLTNNLGRVVDTTVDPSQRKAEFALAMAVEFMRSSYRTSELPTPKRVLGVLAACEALRICERMYGKASE